MNAANGFTLFEFILVSVVIGVIAASSLVYYERTLDRARRTGVEVLANRFTAATALIRSQWVVEGSIQISKTPSPTWRVEVDNIPIFLNQFGWPANTDGGSTNSNDQTAEECYQVWNGVLQNPAPATLERGGNSDNSDRYNKGKQRYHISAINNSICRYELITEPQGTHAFEYDLRTGQVITKVPPLD